MYLRTRSRLSCIAAGEANGVVVLEFAHRLHDARDIFERRARRNTVAEIENVTRTASHFLQKLRGLAREFFGRKMNEHFGIEVALNRDVRWKQFARLRQIK